MLLYSGQHCVYEDAAELIKKFVQVDVSAKQIERLVHHYGPLVSEAYNHFLQTRKRERKDWEPTYVMMDGSMILTREEKWKEVKLGRIFSQSSLLELSPSRNWLHRSTYVAYLGNIAPFLERMGQQVDKLPDPIFINDGAPWIWAWVEQYYPDAVQILDYYHAIEYLWEFAREHFKDDVAMKKWVEKQVDLLMADGVERVILNIEKRAVSRTKEREQKKRLLRYYRTHQKRMNYGTYKADGLLIGSGPIESAHRTVIQERLKKSGQHWTHEGAQALIALRVAQKSHLWEIVQKTIENIAA